MSADPLDKLVHDVNSRCSSLRTAAAMLRDAKDDEADELLHLMREAAATLADAIAVYRRKKGA